MSRKKLLEFGLKEADAFQKNFKIIQLDKYKNRKWAKTFNKNTVWNTKSAMLCKKL